MNYATPISRLTSNLKHPSYTTSLPKNEGYKSSQPQIPKIEEIKW